jgi:hypothetical protein
MKIVLASIFRNSSSYLDRYFTQITNLRSELVERGHSLTYAWAEGDSTDDTFQRLSVHVNPRPDDVLIKVDHGGPVFGSVDNDQRWRNISKVCNALLDAIPTDTDYVIYVESDLLWTADTMLPLLNHVLNGLDAVAPMCFHLPTGMFYDTWGHRKNGLRFTQNSPYHPHINPGIDVTEIDSAGSCIVMNYSVAQHARFDPPELGIVGFGNTLRQLGFKLFLDTTQRVFHP